ncbi:MAG TPA: sodium:alanine symporter family protein [Clostridiales bacterium]|nr:sodium:alanine symporter family protein [Clostridiales bacterium]
MLSGIVSLFNSLLWGAPTLALFIGSGIYFTVRLKFVQFRGFPAAFSAIWQDIKKPAPKDKDQKGLSPVAALAASLGAVMGPGNLVGVSSAILLGGAGAVFWMWVSAILGMASRFAESALAVITRRNRNGQNHGGPMYLMEDMGNRKTAILFALMGVFLSVSMANALPAGALASSLSESYGISPLVTGAVLSALVALTVLGGMKRISSVASVVVPAMSLFFMGAAIFVISMSPAAALQAFLSIFKGAFSLSAGIGGLVGTVIRYGIARGIYSNEAGMGTDPLIAAATSEENPARQGLISMTAPFLDTIVFCTFTALVILMAKDYIPATAGGMPAEAFAYFLPGSGRFIVNVTLALLVFATVSSWACFGEECLLYLTQKPLWQKLYRFFYCIIPVSMAGLSLNLLLDLSDIATALMAIPNLIITMMAIAAMPKGELDITSLKNSARKEKKQAKKEKPRRRVRQKRKARVMPTPSGV